MSSPAIDPENPVVRLCAAGMEAEGAGDPERARAAFQAAWDARVSDLDACIAAHYLARHQPTAEATKEWNLVALDRAEAAGSEAVRELYPSLLLNVAHSHEALGRPVEARVGYERAAAALEALPPGPYADLVRRGVEAGLERVRPFVEGGGVDGGPEGG